MSLSSLLLGSKQHLDADLDTLFKTSAVVKAPVSIPIPGSSKDVSKLKRKLEAANIDLKPARSKRIRPAEVDQVTDSGLETKKKEQTSPKSPKRSSFKSIHTKTSRKGKEKNAELVEEDDTDDNSDLENTYMYEKSSPGPEAHEDADSDKGDAITLIHESVKKDGKKKPKALKKKVVLQDDTPELRDQRTIFVGNLPLEVASKSPLKKQLQRHILSFVPSAKIESVRFRSIPFQTPTSKLPTSEDEGDGPKIVKSKKELRAHEKERASVWKSKLDDKDDEAVKADEKRYLNPAQKKKIAFINQEFHTTADTVNAYIVFAHPVDAVDRPSNLPPLPPTMDPYEAAVGAASKADGSLFLERMIRVDLVGKNKSRKPNTDSDQPALLEEDPRLSVFVGNLEFASKEEDLRAFFEGTLATERGPPLAPSEDAAGDTADSTKPLTWVTRVRIIRDKDTQLGKGFAYIQFSDRECVDEILAMEEDKLKFAKRKLRVQRCKTLPGSKIVAGTKTSHTKQARSTQVPVVVPRGDPALGEKLAGLPKEERKKLKSTDADRLARRLAKKKARMSMAPGVGKGKPRQKERKRVRS